MSIDPVVLRYDEGHSLPWWLSQGRETFFPDLQARTWEHLRWATKEEAIAWAQAQLHITPSPALEGPERGGGGDQPNDPLLSDSAPPKVAQPRLIPD